MCAFLPPAIMNLLIFTQNYAFKYQSVIFGLEYSCSLLIILYMPYYSYDEY